MSGLDGLDGSRFVVGGKYVVLMLQQLVTYILVTAKLKLAKMVLIQMQVVLV
ncbi:MAG: hypothetical protein U1E98_03985 [Moraxella osloensis]